ncbi:MAG: MBOAT family protein [Candidatus Thioglobus sp.]|nr:MAG: MBOAT family protein [Candidatus Thioglobus sp.]
MLFNSYEFLFLFLPITFFVYFYLNHKRLTEISTVFLVLSSLLFYSWWNVIYLPIILSSMLFNYAVGNRINKANLRRKLLLTIGVVANLSLLGYFKYADFFIENINILSASNIPTLDLVLPLAISFFTFQQIAYLVDSYKQETEEYSFLNYALFVTFFPQLIAGPIVHHKEMMPQFAKAKNKVKNYQNIAIGLFIFSIGLFKKVVIADTFSVWATAGFDVATTLNLFEAWATSLSYTFQLYFDFSGYTDMAIGLALLFNIKLPINFNSPYKATNIQDFWKRWHITLSRFLKDYVYIPLGGNREGEFRTYSNLIATFILGGLWHGAGWTFVFWGFLHGLAIVIYRAWNKLGFKLWDWLAWLITFNFINLTWVFFRAKEWDDAVKVLGGMFALDNIVYNLNYLEVAILFAAFIIILFFRNSISYCNNKFQFSIKQILVFVVLMTTSILAIRLGNSSEFLYFNF